MSLKKRKDINDAWLRWKKWFNDSIKTNIINYTKNKLTIECSKNNFGKQNIS